MQAEGTGQCALVLGGGGPLGIAWEVGLLQGWAESWLLKDPTADPMATLLAGRIIGTSAGAIVGAHLAVHGSIANLFSQQYEPVDPHAQKAPALTAFLAALFKAKLFTRDLLSLRRSLGKSARKAALPGEAEWIDVITQSYAPGGAWPGHRELVITGIDADKGELHGWHAVSEVPLPLAVAASCAIPCTFPLVHINGRPYMDGGIGSPTNATLAEGCGRVLILDPLGRMMGNSSPVEGERRSLEAAGSHTLAFFPDRAVADAVGLHVFDVSRRTEVAAHARQQGLVTAAGVWAFLHSSASAAEQARLAGVNL